MLNNKVKNVLLTLLVGAPLAFAISFVSDHLNITLSESVDHRIFWETDAIAGPGDYATFELSHELAGHEPVLISKRLMCWEGQTITQKDLEFFCDGESLGRAKTETLKGDPLPLFSYSGVVPAGKAWAYGSHPDSFDSRYWGFVDVSKTKRLKAIF